MDGSQQHQPDDQHVHPIHRCEGSQRCTRNCAPHRYCRPAVLPRSVPRHRRARRRGGLSLLLARGGGHRLGLCAGRAPEPRHPEPPRPRRAQGHAPRRRATGAQRHRAARGRVVRHRQAMLGGRCRRAESAGHGGDRDRRHHQRRDVVEGPARGRREHAAAERDLVPDRDGVHGGRLERGLAARERRRRDDPRRRHDVVVGDGARERARGDERAAARARPTARPS